MKIVRSIVPVVTTTALLVAVLTFIAGFGSGTASNIEGRASTSRPTTLATVELCGEASGADATLLLPPETGLKGLTKPNDPYIGRQWALGQMHVSALWSLTTGSTEILIAVLDTGIDRGHEDLRGKVVAEVNFTDSPSSNDLNGHGTHVAGIIVAGSNNGKGVAGLAPESRVMNVKVADDYGSCQAMAVARGIIWAVENGAKVINISIELRDPSAELEQAVNYAWSRGAVIVAAAGNRAGTAPVYPAYYEKCIAVSATGQADELAPLSNYGDWVDVAAPGSSIFSTLPGDRYGYESGTSFATAYVSGLAALLFNIMTDTNGNGRLNDEVRSAIEDGCQKVDAAGTGHGRIDALICSAKVEAFIGITQRGTRPCLLFS
jgi:thermitase